MPARGELVACIGPNGAGKTTLLTILADIKQPDAGTVRRPAPGAVGWVPQQPALYGKLSVAENLRLFARLEGVGDVDAGGCADAGPDGSGGARGRAGRAALGREPPAGQHRDRPARVPRRCCCSTSRARRSTRVSGSGCGPSSASWRAPARRSSTRPTTSPRRSSYADRVLVLADGERLFWGRPQELQPQVTADGPPLAPGDFEAAFVAFLRAARPLVATPPRH